MKYCPFSTNLISSNSRSEVQGFTMKTTQKWIPIDDPYRRGISIKMKCHLSFYIFILYPLSDRCILVICFFFHFDGFQCFFLVLSCYKHPSVCLFVCLMLAPWWILAEQWRKIKRINLTGSFLFSVFSYFLSMLVSMMILRFFCLPMHVASKNPFNITTNEIKFNEEKTHLFFKRFQNQLLKYAFFCSLTSSRHKNKRGMERKQ